MALHQKKLNNSNKNIFFVLRYSRNTTPESTSKTSFGIFNIFIN